MSGNGTSPVATRARPRFGEPKVIPRSELGGRRNQEGQDVVQRHESIDAAVFVDDDGDMYARVLKLLQDIERRRPIRDE